MKLRNDGLLGLTLLPWLCASVSADLVTDPNDPRSWQGATVGTFALLFYGADTPANRQLVVDNQLLDDGLFDVTGSTPAALVTNAWSTAQGAGGCIGASTDLTGTGDLGYSCGATDLFTAANSIDNTWFQSSGTVGQTVFDLGLSAPKTAIFNTIDHGPLPQEAIESTAYLSNDMVTWTQAVVQRVWLEGFQSILGIHWDGFVFVVGTATGEEFRYVSVIHGGPGALIDDGDDEINGVLGVGIDFDDCSTTAAFANYGSGALGTLGVPGLSLNALPRLGTTFGLVMGNSAGRTTPACLLFGDAPTFDPTRLGFDLLVDHPLRMVPLMLGSGDTLLPMTLSNSITHCGRRYYLQLVQLDPGASRGVSASAGLEVVLGM
jgi:hypothetical protein